MSVVGFTFGNGRERDPPDDCERGHRRHQRHHPRRRAAALVPGEAAASTSARIGERGRLPGHRDQLPADRGARPARASGRRPPPPSARATSVEKCHPPREHLGRVAVGDHDALAHQHDAVGERRGELRVVGRDDDRGATGRERARSGRRARPCARGPSPASARRGSTAAAGRPPSTTSSASRWRSPPDRSRGLAPPRPASPARAQPLVARLLARVLVDQVVARVLEQQRDLARALDLPARRVGEPLQHGAAACTCRPRCGPSARPARRGATRRSSPRRIAGPSSDLDHRPRAPAARRRRRSARGARSGLRVGWRRGRRRAAASRASFTDAGSGPSPASEKSRATGVASAASARSGPLQELRRAPRRRRARRLRIASTRSAAGRQRSSRCSAITTAVPHSSFSRRSSQISSSPATGSSCDVGSSSTSSAGRWTSAAAIATRCSSPPESVSVRRSSSCADPERERDLLDRARDHRGGRLAAVLERQRELGAHAAHHDLRLGILEHGAAHGCELARAVFAHVEPADLELALDVAAVEVRHEPAERAQERRLAGAGRRRRAP